MTTLKKTTLALLGLGLATAVAPSAQAATLLGSYTHDYGSLPGRIDPTGTDVVNPLSVTVSDNSSGRFADKFDFSNLSYSSITSFVLTLAYAEAGPSVSVVYVPGIGATLVPTELWTVRVQGTDSSSALDDYYGLLSGGPIQSFALSAADDVAGTSAFAQSVASQVYEFWFSEWTTGNDKFKLASATLDVYGKEPAPVPLPASGLLLAGAMGGVAAFRRRKA